MEDVVVELADAVLGFLDLEPAEPYNDPNIVTVRSQQTAWVIFQVTKNYTRGVGFSQDEEGVWSVDPALQAVIVSAAARYGAVRPGQGAMTLEEFTANELAVLHQFRIRNA